MLDWVPIITVSFLDGEEVVCYPDLRILGAVIPVHEIHLESSWELVLDDLVYKAWRINRWTFGRRADGSDSVSSIIQAGSLVILIKS